MYICYSTSEPRIILEKNIMVNGEILEIKSQGNLPLLQMTDMAYAVREIRQLTNIEKACLFR